MQYNFVPKGLMTLFRLDYVQAKNDTFLLPCGCWRGFAVLLAAWQPDGKGKENSFMFRFLENAISKYIRMTPQSERHLELNLSSWYPVSIWLRLSCKGLPRRSFSPVQCPVLCFWNCWGLFLFKRMLCSAELLCYCFVENSEAVFLHS